MTSLPISVRPFLGLRDAREGPHEFVEDIDFACDQAHQSRTTEFQDRAKRFTFRQSLNGTAWEWYQDQLPATKSSWPILREAFLKAYELKEQDVKRRQFELQSAQAALAQGVNESISDYLRRASELNRRLNQPDTNGMATARGLRDGVEKRQVAFFCNQASDYSFNNVERLIKAAYTDVGAPDPFNSSQDLILARTQKPAPEPKSDQDLVRNLIEGQSQFMQQMVTMVQTLSLPNPATSDKKGHQVKFDSAKVLCYKCNEHGHYASSCPTNMTSKQPKAITANAAVSQEQMPGSRSILPRNAKPTDEERNYHPSVSACFLSVGTDLNHIPPQAISMAAQHPDNVSALQKSLPLALSLLVPREAGRGSPTPPLMPAFRVRSDLPREL